MSAHVIRLHDHAQTLYWWRDWKDNSFVLEWGDDVRRVPFVPYVNPAETRERIVRALRSMQAPTHGWAFMEDSA